MPRARSNRKMCGGGLAPDPRERRSPAGDRQHWRSCCHQEPPEGPGTRPLPPRGLNCSRPVGTSRPAEARHAPGVPLVHLCAQLGSQVQMVSSHPCLVAQLCPLPGVARYVAHACVLSSLMDRERKGRGKQGEGQGEREGSPPSPKRGYLLARPEPIPWRVMASTWWAGSRAQVAPEGGSASR